MIAVAEIGLAAACFATMSADPTEYRLTTAEIVYHLPDAPDTLQTFIWQKFDRAPDFPELGKFLDFWRGNIEGRLHSVTVAQGRTRPRRFPHIVPAAGRRHQESSD
jgi:uncharacterized protein Usg